MAPDSSDGTASDGPPGKSEGPAPLRAEAHNSSGCARERDFNRLLEADPQSVQVNIRKADYRLRAGDDEVACYFYRRALRLAGDRTLPEAEAAEVRRAELALAEAAARLQARRTARLTERRLPPQQWTPRLRASIDAAAGPQPSELQDPTHHYFPGLPQIEFYDRDQFEWAPAVEAATAVIRDELLGLLARRAGALRPFTQTDLGLPLGVGKTLLDGRDWGVLAFCEQGWLEPEIVESCPRTWETVLRHAPIPRVAGWGPSVIFSILKGGGHIGAHTGMYNTRLICHLPLIVPPGCRFRVGDEVREWEEGKLLIFDDTIEHEAWNDSNEDRAMLIFDIWRPELSEQEKRELTFLFSD